MPDEEIRARMKALTGPNWETGFPIAEMARRIKYPKNRLQYFRDGREDRLPKKYRLFKGYKRRLVDLLLKIECGMITCTITREHRNPKIPWMTSICKKFTYSDVPTKPIKPVHRVIIDRSGASVQTGSNKEMKVLPSFLGAFGNNAPTNLPTKLLLKK